MPFGGLLTVGIIGSGIAQGIIGKSAASTAAEQQQAAAQKAIDFTQGQGDKANSTLADFYQKNIAQLQPYLQLGQQGTQELSQQLAPGGGLTQSYAPFTAPNPQGVANTPEYQFAAQQGGRAIENSAAARGTDLSGGTLKDLNTFGQGLASNQYQNAFQNALQSYNTNFNTFNTGGTNLYNRLMGITNTGEQGAGAAVTSGNETAQSTSQNYMNLGQLVGNLYTDKGNAQAAGTVGGANQINSAIGGTTNTLASLYGQLYGGNGTNASNSTQAAQVRRGF